MYNNKMDWFINNAIIVSEALETMTELWDQMQYEDCEPETELATGYPVEKSFDEFVYEFREWVNGFAYDDAGHRKHYYNAK